MRLNVSYDAKLKLKKNWARNMANISIVTKISYLFSLRQKYYKTESIIIIKL